MTVFSSDPETASQRVVGPLPATLPRRARSIRRTMTIDSRWPDGQGSHAHILGRARDVVTERAGAAPITVGHDEIHAVMDSARTVVHIESVPSRPGLGALVGARAGSRLRTALADAVPAELAGSSPLYLLLDDLAGASLVSGIAFSGLTEQSRRPPDRRAGRRMQGVCIGFRPGSAALDDDGSARSPVGVRAVNGVVDAADPAGWHELPTHTGISARRSRRMDVWFDGADVLVDAFFQDSAARPNGTRIAIHEYGLTARASWPVGELEAVVATPRILPFDECPAARSSVDALVGLPLSSLRTAVPELLKGTLGCTHLNDMARSLANVPRLAQSLADTQASREPS